MSKIIGKLNPKSNQRLIVYDKKHNAPTLQCAMGTGGGQVPLIIEISDIKVKIKQATNKGFIECRVGGVVDMGYPNSKTRRGRVINNGDIAPTIQCNENNILRIEYEKK